MLKVLSSLKIMFEEVSSSVSKVMQKSIQEAIISRNEKNMGTPLPTVAHFVATFLLKCPIFIVQFFD